MKDSIKNLKIVNELGLHTRAAAEFVKTANRFKSNISVKRGDQIVDGKSIMSLLMLGAGFGTEITLSTYGEDQEEALKILSKLVQTGFNE